MSRKNKSRVNSSKSSVITAVSVSLIGASGVALAGPTGGTVVGGAATIAGTTIDGKVATLITQSTNKAVINWDDFSIPAAELVKFAQQAGTGSITLNRVTGNQLSNIQGALEANGNIFLINPNGILFGSGAKVDVAGLLASTLDVDTDAFMNGDHLSFSQVNGKGLASIQNQGEIKVGDGGFVYLVAPKVDNSGYVIANVGSVTMAAGNRFNVDLSGNGLINFNVSADALGSAATDADKAGVSNSGQVTAQHVLLAGNETSAMMASVVNNSGVIEATDLNISGAEIVQAGTVTAAGTATLKATNSIKTPGASTRAATLNLEVTADGASIGEEDTALRVDADTLNAKAANGHVLVTDVAGGVALGEVTTGIKDNVQQRRVIIKSEGGSITSANPLKTNVSGWSANLVADGAIGTDAQALTTSVDVLTASTQNGGINIQDLDGELALGAITAREAISINGQTSAATAFSDADGKITLSNGAAGTKNVTIKAKDDLFLTDSVSTGNALTLTSELGSLYSTSSAVQLTGKTLNLNAGKGIAVDGGALKIQSETLNAMALGGGIYLNEGKGLTIGTVSAAGTDNNVSIAVDQGDIKLGSIDAAGGKITLTSTNGAITDNNTAAMNLRANELALTATNAIGTAANGLETSASAITAQTSAAQAGIFLANDTALSSLTAATSNGDTKVDFLGGQFSFTRSNSQLSVTGVNPLDLAFSNNAGNIIVNGLNIGDKGLSLNSSGAITQAGTDAIVAQNITLNATGNIGSAGSALHTDTQKLGLTSTNGIINVNNTGSAPLSVSATANGTNGAVTLAQQGDLLVDSVIAKTNVSLTAGGQLIAGNTPSGVNVTAASMTLAGGSIGTSGVAFVSSVVGPVAITSAGDINARNTGAISLLNATAGGKLAFNNAGDVTVGALQAGDTLKFAISGKATDGNGDGVNFIATGLDSSSRSFGTSGDALELHVDSLTIDTKSGAIYASNLGGQKLSLISATSGGTGSDISISNEGDIDLGVLNAGGNNAILKSTAGAIEDARAWGTTDANVTARNLDIRAPGGIGNNGDLALDVSFLAAAGGNGGVKATNAGAIAVDSSTLVGKGVSEISIIATDITVLNNNGGTITMDGGKLVMTATTGNIVFLNQNDTIYLPGGGSITLTAMGHSDLDGYNGAIVAGNLKTDGGAIKLQAQSNITIGMLDAGSGDVSVLSSNGIILDGNGSRENIIGNHVTLQASTPSLRDAELSRDTAIADYAAKVAEANAKLFDLQVLIQQLKSYETQVQSATVQKQIAAANEWLTQVMVDAQQAKVDSAESVLNGLNTALKAATLIRNAAAFIAGAAQAVPFSGDAGADAIFAGVDVAMSIADLAVDSYERYTFNPMAGQLDTLSNQLDVAKSVNIDADSNLAMASLIRDTVQTSKQMADLAVFKINTARDASEQIRRQAVAAYDLNKDIDSSATKPLGITANRLDVNAGGTLNTSLYLDTQGHLGLGDIALAVGQQIVAKAAQDLSVVGTVKSDTAITLKAGGAILGAGGTLITPDLQAVAGNGIGMNQAINTQVSRLAVKGGDGGVNILNRTGADLTVGTLGTVQGATGAGDITLDTDGSLIVNKLIQDTTGTHDVTLNSGGAIVDGNGTDRNVQGGRLFANTRNGAELDTEVAQVSAQATAFGNLTIRDASDLIARNLLASSGNLNIQAAGHLTAGSLTVNPGTGAITLAAGGRIDDDQDNTTGITANQLTLKAGGAIGATGGNTARALDTRVNRIDGSASGEINIAEQDDLNIGRLETDHGNVTVTSATGSLNVDTLHTGTTSDTLSLIAANQITNARTDAGSNLTAANMTLSAAHGIGAGRGLNIQAQRLEADGGTGGINLTDLDGGLVIGDVTPNLGNAALEGLHVTGGDLKVQAKQGDLGFEKAVINDGNGDIALAADGSILLNHAVTGRRNIAVNAGGNIDQNVNLQTQAGNITMASTGGNVTMADGVATRVIGAGNVNYSAGGNLLISRIDAQQGDVTLGAQAGGIVGQDSVSYNVASRGLIATAANGIGNLAGALKTKVDTLIARVTQGGSIQVTDADALQLSQVSNANGLISVNAGGDITALDVQSANGPVVLQTTGNVATTADGLIRANDLRITAGNGVNVRTRADAATVNLSNGELRINELGDIRLDNLATANGNVVVSAGGQIGVNSVNAGNGTNDVTLSAGSAIIKAGPAQTLVGNALALTAGNGIGNGALGALALEGNRLNAQSSASDIRLNAAHGLAVDSLVANNGNLDLQVSQGDAQLGTVYAKGQANLNTAQGSLVDDGNADTRLVADSAALSAAGGIGGNAALQTQVNGLVANASNGAVNIDELDGLNSLTVNSPNADVNVHSATGNLVVNDIQAAGRTVSLQTPGGAVRDARTGVASVTADRLLLDSAKGVGQAGNLLDVSVHDLSAQGGNGGVYVNNLYGGTLTLSDAGYGTALNTAGGDIYLNTAGGLNLAQKVSNTGGGNITLKAAGSVAQGSDIAAVGAGNITVTSGGSIAMGNGVTSSSDTGTISYNAKDSLSLSNIRTGGRAVFVAPSIIDNAPGVSNVKAWVIDMDSRAANTGLITDLVGETADAALIRLDYRPIGGSLLQSRRFMDELLKPVGMPQHVSLASTVMDMSHGTNPMLAPTRLVTDNTSKSLASEEPAASTEE
jgi:filamentous hemagglutinin family protein